MVEDRICDGIPSDDTERYNKMAMKYVRKVMTPSKVY